MLSATVSVNSNTTSTVTTPILAPMQVCDGDKRAVAHDDVNAIQQQQQAVPQLVQLLAPQMMQPPPPSYNTVVPSATNAAVTNTTTSTAICGGNSNPHSFNTSIATPPNTKSPRPSSGSSSNGKNSKSRRAPRIACDRNLIVNYVPEELSEKELAAVFAPYGKVTNCRIVRNAEGLPKGYGFVKFQEVESARQCVEKMNGFEILGKRLRINIARPDKGEQLHNRPHFEELVALKEATGSAQLPHKLLAQGFTAKSGIVEQSQNPPSPQQKKEETMQTPPTPPLYIAPAQQTMKSVPSTNTVPSAEQQQPTFVLQPNTFFPMQGAVMAPAQGQQYFVPAMVPQQLVPTTAGTFVMQPMMLPVAQPADVTQPLSQ